MGTERPSGSLLGSRVGSIRVVEMLGEGGMGAVYGGIDEKLQRRVALKAIRCDLAGAANKLRFLREARMLSKLNHPNICAIYDFIEDQQTELLVLEMVAGRSLKDAIVEGLGVGDKMRICRQLTEALTVAHSRGVVHRDLKPDNVMLTDEGEVKILDFGLAQILSERESSTKIPPAPRQPTPGWPEEDSEETVASPMTVAGRVAGTAAFMSPEQAMGEPAVAASDIYSLGLLFQQLWTGRSPHEQGLSRQTLLFNAARGESLPPTGIDPAVSELIQRMKERAPEQRPSGAQVLDRLRWIDERPRRRVRLAAIALALIAVVLAGVKYTTDLRRERNSAVAARAAEEQSRREAEEVKRFLIDLFAVSRPGKAQGNTVTARELLDAGAERIGRELASQPLTQARLGESIGAVYSLLGLYEPANELLEMGLKQRLDLLGEDHPEVAASHDALSICYKVQGRLEEAEQHGLRALAIREEMLGADHPDTAKSLNNIGLLYWSQGRYQEAEQTHRRCLELSLKLYGPDHSSVASCHNNLGEVLREQGRLEEAESHLRRAYEIKRIELGATHPDLASTMNNLGQLCWQLENWEDAEAYFLGAMEINQRVFGEQHIKVAAVLNNLATLYDDQGKAAEAESMYLRSLEITEKAVGADHPRVAVALNNLAELYQNSDRPELAIEFYGRALTVFENGLGVDHPYVAYPLVGLAKLARSQGRPDDAVVFLRRALRIREAKLGVEHQLYLETRDEMTALMEELTSSPIVR